MEGKRSVNLTGSWDTRISRRVLLRTGGSAAAGLFMLGRAASSAAAPPWDAVNPFSLGVASGDPTPDGFVLWTRLLPEGTPLDGSVMKQEPYGVRYEIAADPEFRTIVRRGAEEAVWEESHTVHAEIAGLQPATLVLVPVQVGTGDQRRRPDAHRAAARRAGRQAPLRVRVVPELARRLLHGVRRPRRAGPRPRRPSRRLHLRGRRPERRDRRRARWRRCAGRRDASPSPTTGPATRSTRPTRSCRRRTGCSRGWRRGTTTRWRTTTPAS